MNIDRIDNIDFNNLVSLLNDTSIVFVFNFLDFSHYLPVLYDKYLTCDDKTRLDKLIIEKKRSDFIVSRCVLRLILSKLLSCDLKDIKFFFNQNGKPFLLDNSIYFNLSHCSDFCVIAIDKSNEIGIDIQKPKLNANVQLIAKRFFCKNDYEWLLSRPIHEQETVFYRLWTAKEAACKALGAKLWSCFGKFCVASSKDKFSLHLEHSSFLEHSVNLNLVYLNLISDYFSCFAIQNKFQAVKVVRI